MKRVVLFANVKLILPGLLALVSIGAQAASVRDRILDSITNAQVVEDQKGLRRLYGVVINGSDTNQGRWGCARVVSSILHQAGVPIQKNFTAVREVEAFLRGWQKIENYDDVQAGDVIVYKSIFNSSGECTGGGNCHVVIAVSDSEAYGNVGVGVPYVVDQGPQVQPMYWLIAVGFEFKEAFRPPN